MTWVAEKTADPSHLFPGKVRGLLLTHAWQKAWQGAQLNVSGGRSSDSDDLEGACLLLSLPPLGPCLWAPGCIFISTLQGFLSLSLLRQFLLGMISSLDPWLYSHYFSYLYVPQLQTVACPWFGFSLLTSFTISSIHSSLSWAEPLLTEFTTQSWLLLRRR